MAYSIHMCRVRSRQWSLHSPATAAFLLQVALVLVDEVHLLNETGRGSALEAGVVCRIKMVGRLKEMQQVGGAWLSRHCCAGVVGDNTLRPRKTECAR